MYNTEYVTHQSENRMRIQVLAYMVNYWRHLKLALSRLNERFEIEEYGRGETEVNCGVSGKRMQISK